MEFYRRKQFLKFYFTEGGYLLKLCRKVGETQMNLVEERVISDGEKVEQLEIITDEYGDRFVIVSTFSKIHILSAATPICWLDSNWNSSDPYGTRRDSLNRCEFLWGNCLCFVHTRSPDCPI